MTTIDTKQFVDFNRVVELNEWLRLYSTRIIIDSWQVLRLGDQGISYVLQFHLAPITAKQIASDTEDPHSYADQLDFLIKEAYRLQ